MRSYREVLKRALPEKMRDAIIRVRAWTDPPPLEEIALHDYLFVTDPAPGRRLTLVLPHVTSGKAFGGITTAVELAIGVAHRSGAEMRVLLDDFHYDGDRTVLDGIAHENGLDPARVEVVGREAWIPSVAVRANDVFMGFHSWITLNLLPLLREQVRVFGGAPRPLLYPIQEYEPLFYPMSSTHMMARAAFDIDWPCWGLFNSSELYAYFEAQGHNVARAFVFEPQLSRALRPFLAGEAPAKERRILVYGRPSIPRNCFPAVVKGLQRWASDHAEYAEWDVVSAGLAHRPVPIGAGRSMRSLGKLSLESYASLLRGSAVGLSLMSSPHPSYPPLEMAHFGLRTVTNSYSGKDLSLSHPNIVSVRSIAPEALAEALAKACAAFEAAPGAGWRAASARCSFLDSAPYPCMDDIVRGLCEEVWQA